MFKIGDTASIIILNKNKVLLLLRDDIDTIPSPNKWALIGGFIEGEESAEIAVRREAMEEAGVELKEIEKIGSYKYPNGRTTTIFLTILEDDKANNLKKGEEGQEIKFFNFNELSSIELAGSIKRLYENDQDELKKIMETKNLSNPK